MSVRILTGEDGAVLYDATSGFAFGQVFEGKDQAEAFLVWLPPKLDPGTTEVTTGQLRSMSEHYWRRYYNEFFDECIDEDTGELKEGVPTE